jgi:hypothetical protein
VFVVFIFLSITQVFWEMINECFLIDWVQDGKIPYIVQEKPGPCLGMAIFDYLAFREPGQI